MNTEGPCRILLIGMMGSGKSTIGQLLSNATGWPYLDNDELVQRSRGATSRQIVEEHGEAQMREAEADALALGVTVATPAVIGVAAGAILEAADREQLRLGGIVVWLRADASELESRAIGAEHRPWLDTDGGSWIRDAVAEREPLYASVADMVIDTGTGDAEASTAEILDRLHRISACAEIR